MTTQPSSTVLGSGAEAVYSDASFEIQTLTPGGFVYNPSGNAWTFSAASGLARNGSPWFVNAAPNGNQAVFLQNSPSLAVTPTITQTIHLPTYGKYGIRFHFVRRSGAFPGTQVEVRLNGELIGPVLPNEQPDDVWRTKTLQFICRAPGNHVLEFRGTRTGADFATAIDNVQVLGGTTFQVAFTPATPGLRTAMLSIPSNDSDENPFEITLTGTGINPAPPMIDPLSLKRLANGNFQFSFQNTNNLNFTVLTTTNIALPVTNWTVLGLATNVGGGIHQFTDETATNAADRFYQLRFP